MIYTDNLLPWWSPEAVRLREATVGSDVIGIGHWSRPRRLGGMFCVSYRIHQLVGTTEVFDRICAASEACAHEAPIWHGCVEFGLSDGRDLA